MFKRKKLRSEKMKKVFFFCKQVQSAKQGFKKFHKKSVKT